jgi:hypothetical protein
VNISIPDPSSSWMAAAGTPGLVSIIIPTHNRARLVAEALTSAARQTYRPLEIVLVDDASTDDTPAVVARWREQAGHEDVALQVLRLPDNRGAAAARNHGLAHASGEFIGFLDSDDLLLSCKTTWQVQVLQQHPEASHCYGITGYVDARGEVVELLGEPASADPALEAVRPRCGCMAPLWRREALRRAGPWDEHLTGREDWVHRARAVLKAGPGVFMNEPVCVKRLHTGKRISRHGDATFARHCWECAQAVKALLAADARATPAARTELAAQMSGVFRSLLRARADAEAEAVLTAMAALAEGPRRRHYQRLRKVWFTVGPSALRMAGRLSGRL